MHIFAVYDGPEYIDPAFAVVVSLFLIMVLLIITLVSLRRQKIKRDRLAYQARQAARREAAIAQLNAEDEAFSENLKSIRRDNRESHARHR